jgi:hypothetical protein
MEGDDVQPPSTTSIIAFSGSGKARVNSALQDVAVSLWGMRGAGEVTGRGERQSGGQMAEGGESGNGGGKW